MIEWLMFALKMSALVGAGIVLCIVVVIVVFFVWVLYQQSQHRNPFQ
jgi:hypothetical protein